MTKEEVMSALKEIKSTYAPITIDITPEGESNSQNRDKARSLLVAVDENRDSEKPENLEDYED